MNSSTSLISPCIMNYINSVNTEYKDFKTNVQLIVNKSLLKHLREDETNIYFDYGFNELLSPGDIPDHVKCIYFHHLYALEIKKNVLPINLEVLVLGNYIHKITLDMLPSKLWFLSTNSGPIDDLIIDNEYECKYSGADDIKTKNNIIVFTCNYSEPYCVSFDKDTSDIEYDNILQRLKIKNS